MEFTMAFQRVHNDGWIPRLAYGMPGLSAQIELISGVMLRKCLTSKTQTLNHWYYCYTLGFFPTAHPSSS